MDGAESTADEFDSSYCSSSDQDVPDSDSSPERAPSSRVPALALGVALSSDHPIHRRPMVPAFRLPAAKSHDNVDSGMQAPVQQPVGLPQLSLQTDQTMTTAVPEDADTSSMGTAEPSGREDPEAPQYRADTHGVSCHQHPMPMFTVQLASEAFAIHSGALQEPSYSKMSQTQAVRNFCASQLGLKSSSLKFFELHEIEPPTEISEGCTTLAIAVEGSVVKSLADVRSLVDQESHECGEKQAKLERLTQELQAKVAHCQKLERQLKDKSAHCQKLEKEVTVQRQRMQKSDATRLQGQNNLDQLKADFDQLSAYVSRSSSLDPSSPRRSGSLSPAVSGSPVSRKLSRNPSIFPDDETADKVFGVLESLRQGDESILSKLQDVLDAVCQRRPADTTPG
ncbi:hypothetical protein ABBQ38_002995 [Trebouxia sp. C0009 RCD-2024]